MAQYCEICKQFTNCTDDCERCLKEEAQLYADLQMEQKEQM